MYSTLAGLNSNADCDCFRTIAYHLLIHIYKLWFDIDRDLLSINCHFCKRRPKSDMCSRALCLFYDTIIANDLLTSTQTIKPLLRLWLSKWVLELIIFCHSWRNVVRYHKTARNTVTMWNVPQSSKWERSLHPIIRPYLSLRYKQRCETSKSIPLRQRGIK